jgi:predicted glycoside hydrolase/deacetylase ChbG (UPF0249 family)
LSSTEQQAKSAQIPEGQSVEPVRKIVVNVDDLGLHPAVNRFVAHSAGSGAITSASVMANGPHMAEAESMLAQGRFAGIGLGGHLNVLRGRPLSSIRDVASTVGADGRFPGSFSKLYRNLMLGRTDPAEVELEWGRQIEYLLDRGFRLDHLNAEQHTHCMPPLWPVIGRLAQRFGIGWVRRPYERPPAATPLSGQAKTWLLRSWLSRAQPLPAGVRCTEAVWGIAQQGRHLNAGALSGFVRGFGGNGPVEVICHPGMPADDDPPLSPDLGPMKVHRNWRAEADVIGSPQWRAALERAGFVPCNYEAIG